MSLRCEGFNDQNEYDRQDPCDQGYLRKMARRTDAKLLQRWFNRDVVDIFKQHHAFDSEGIFIGDATYLFVPDNSHYEGSSVLLFDEHNHPDEGRQNYALRTTIEERHRQLKCFSDLEDFSSRAFCLIVNQVVFVLLTYSLLPWYLLRAGRKELNPKTRTRTLELLQPTTTAILIYYQNYVACLSPLQHQELVLTLNEQARKKILAKTHRLCRSLAHQLDSARPP